MISANLLYRNITCTLSFFGMKKIKNLLRFFSDMTFSLPCNPRFQHLATGVQPSQAKLNLTKQTQGPFFNYVRVKGWVGSLTLCSKNPLLLAGVGTWLRKGQKHPYVIKEWPLSLIVSKKYPESIQILFGQSDKMDSAIDSGVSRHR